MAGRKATCRIFIGKSWACNFDDFVEFFVAERREPSGSSGFSRTSLDGSRRSAKEIVRFLRAEPQIPNEIVKIFADGAAISYGKAGLSQTISSAQPPLSAKAAKDRDQNPTSVP